MSKIIFELPEINLLAVDLSAPDTFRSLGTGKWLELEEICYTDPKANVKRLWEVCRRKKTTIESKTRVENIDAIDVHAIIRSPELPPTIILVIQYRPALGQYTVEFPSGLIDSGETAETAALRELREETGYVGIVKYISDPICYEPGLTDSKTKIVHVEIDITLRENLNLQQSLEDDEWSLQVIKVALPNLYQVLQGLQKKHENLSIDSRLYAYAFGLHMANNFL
ncbi:hypothetical protein G9A89_009625 [Geosiphon pyriformis]|nr:hypothetical protein G9A89_009625 [Geosiphon pyriformis]